MKPQRPATAKTGMPVLVRAGRWMLALLLFGAMGWGVLQLSARVQDPQRFPLKVVRIQGNFKHLDRRKLEQAMAEPARGGFFTLDVERLRARLLRMPWVAGVELRRVWPDTLLVNVEEQKPLARWGAAQLVNRQGELFRPAADEIPAGLARLEGPEGSGREMVARYLAMQARFDAIGLRIARLRQDSRSAWRVEFTDGSAIRLGSRRVDERLTRFIRLYPRLVASGRGRPQQVDLRYTNGFVVHWAPAGRPALSEKGSDQQNELG